MDELSLTVTAQAREAGRVALDADGKLAFPRLNEKPGIYRFMIQHSSGKRTVYVGETDRLRRRLQHYRSPGPTQRTNVRLNDLMCSVLADGGRIHVAVIERADGNGAPLDLQDKSARVLVESAWLVELKEQGFAVENA